MTRRRASGGRFRRRLVRFGRFKLSLPDFAIGTGRKVGDFVALPMLGWIYVRLLVLGHPPTNRHAGADDPDLRQALWVARLLIMAQGWDVSMDRLAADRRRLRDGLPARASPVAPGTVAGREGGTARWAFRRLSPTLGEPVAVRLGRFMDLCIAIANSDGGRRRSSRSPCSGAACAGPLSRRRPDGRVFQALRHAARSRRGKPGPVRTGCGLSSRQVLCSWGVTEVEPL